MGQQDKETEYIEQYSIEKYKRPSITADVALFTVLDKSSGDYRKLPEKHLSILLIKRANYPYKDMWALPGGFVHPGETIDQAAYRELSEESGVRDVSLSQLEVFSAPGRDPRGWIISCAFMAMASAEQFVLKPDTDAADSRWFEVNLLELKKSAQASDDLRLTTYELTLTCDGAAMTALLEKRTRGSRSSRQTDYNILSSDGLAFDHARIIAAALTSLRRNLDVSLLAYNLLPGAFSLTELQMVYEVILNKKMTTANFRRKTSDYVIETDDYSTAAGHRPAKLYKRNPEAFEKID